MLTSPKVVCGGDIPDAEPFENPAVERLIAGCLSKDPSGRLPSMQKVLLELKLATLFTRHAGVSTARQRDLEALDAGIQESEARRDARMKEHEKSVAERQQAATEALSALRAEYAALDTRLTGTQRMMDDNPGRLEALERSVNFATSQLAALETTLSAGLHALEKQMTAQAAIINSLQGSIAQTDNLVGRVVEAFEAKMAAFNQSAGESVARLDSLSQTIDATGRQNAALEARVVKAIHQFDCDIEAQTAIVENVRSSMAQTDDLVGRVVEAVESILLDLGTVRP
jgi:chromosome segregation ATPase